MKPKFVDLPTLVLSSLGSFRRLTAADGSMQVFATLEGLDHDALLGNERSYAELDLAVSRPRSGAGPVRKARSGPQVTFWRFGSRLLNLPVTVPSGLKVAWIRPSSSASSNVARQCLLPSLGFEAERASVFRNSTLDLIRRTIWKV
jgi:hypothetical protein